MDYLARMRRRIEGKERCVPGRLGDKLVGRELATLIGVRSATIVERRTGVGLPDDLSSLPTRFVLKPVFGSTSMGVLLLERAADGFVDLTTGAVLAPEDVVDVQKKVADHFTKAHDTAEFLVEELLVSPDGEIPPQDVRFYAFQGEIGLILKEDHMHEVTRAMYFGSDFSPLRDVRSKYGVHAGVAHMEEIVDAVVPERAEELLSVARRISVAVPSPFARIDLLLATGGVYLGEITLYPGTFYYGNRKLMSPGESERLGSLWESAERRLLGSAGFQAEVSG
ncbi:ATP-grasp fold amidoligase family protein [Isoptericola sp. NPDC057191]|uniref:ATP-grasp fold amidoligase family protein n=1 Tax=Isoptericola sp. NPDC057191 TaxID=3346041 RepID=UPI00363190BA